MKKIKAADLLFLRGLAASRDEASRLIMAALAIADDKRIEKPGDLLRPDAVLRLKSRLPYASRGGFKLAAAAEAFDLDMEGAVVIDVGASAGGFTDVCLRRGAAKVYAVDVGRAQLHEKLRRDPRVTVLENVNFRTADFSLTGEKADFIVADVSFISLRLVIPPVVLFCRSGSVFVPLIKPQFEAAREKVGAGGIVRDTEARRDAVSTVFESACENGFQARGLLRSPVTGAKGNVEYLGCFVYSGKRETFDKSIIERVTGEERGADNQAQGRES